MFDRFSKRPYVLLLDNYDSFTYNLYDYFLQLHVDCRVVRNNEQSVADLLAQQPDAIVLSPGPGRPQESGVLLQLISEAHQTIPILGICLGHQALGEFFGARLVKALKPMHGKVDWCFPLQVQHPIFAHIPLPFSIMRYHSLILEGVEQTPLQVLATSSNHDEVMMLVHSTLPIYGIQFHPESILTIYGKQLLDNWLRLVL